MIRPNSSTDASGSSIAEWTGRGNANQETTMSEASNSSLGSAVLELLDSASGVLLQTWSFPEKQRILIGRADECDLVVANPYVSRSHAYLERDEEGWQVVAISSQQLLADGQRKQTIRLRQGDIFRLGTQGCDLRFREVHAEAEEDGGSGTLMFDPDSCPILHLDRDQLQREVAEIETGSYFQNLSETVKKMKQARGSR